MPQSCTGFGSLLSETPFTLETPAAQLWSFAQCLALTTHPRTMFIHNTSSWTGYWVMPLELNTNKSVWKLSSKWKVGNRNAGFLGILYSREISLKWFGEIIFKACSAALWEETPAVWLIDLFWLPQIFSKSAKWIWWPQEMSLGPGKTNTSQSVKSIQ